MRPKLKVHEKLIRDILSHGGSLEHLNLFFDDKLSEKFSKMIVKMSKKSHLFNVDKPFNYLPKKLDVFNKDKSDPSFKEGRLKFNSKSKNVSKNIELIKYKPGEIAKILEMIDELDFMPAPSPYVLGLGVEHKDIVQKSYGRVISLDKKNIIKNKNGDDCFFYIDSFSGYKLKLIECSEELPYGYWIAVIRKKHLSV